MNPKNPRWEEFYHRLHHRLEGSEGCANDRTRPQARAILEKMGNIDIEKSMAYFEEHDGYCDCEILLNMKSG